KLSKADLVVKNGGGYDAFMTTMLAASGADIDTIEADAFSGLPLSADIGNEPHDHDHGEGDANHHADYEAHDAGHTLDDDSHDHGDFNEHLWYSVPMMTKLVDEVATHLGESLPEHKDEFQSNAKDYKAELDELQGQIETVKDDHGGEKVARSEEHT